MIDRRGQTGESKLGCILWTLLLAAGIMVGWKAIPVKIKSAELYDFMVEQAKWAANSSEETLQRSIVAKAIDLDLPVESRQISVTKAGGKVKMQAVYTVPLEFPGYTYFWEFNQQVDRPVYNW